MFRQRLILGGMKVGEYLRKAIIDQAKIDARAFNKMIEEL